MSSVLNPDSTMMQQSEGHWMQYLALVLAKLAPGGVTITAADMKKMASSGEMIVLTHGHVDSIEFKLVTRAEADRIVAYDKTRKGTA